MTTRIITATQYQQVQSIAARAERDPNFLALPQERLVKLQTWLATCDKQAGEYLEFEQPNAHEVLDQKLLCWRYFVALNYLREEAIRRIATLELAEIFGTVA